MVWSKTGLHQTWKPSTKVKTGFEKMLLINYAFVSNSELELLPKKGRGLQ